MIWFGRFLFSLCLGIGLGPVEMKYRCIELDFKGLWVLKLLGLCLRRVRVPLKLLGCSLKEGAARVTAYKHFSLLNDLYLQITRARVISTLWLPLGKGR